MPSEPWTAERLLRMAAAFQPACVLTAAGELGVFDAVGHGPTTAGQAAEVLRTDLRATTRLLDALVGLELLDKQGDAYSTPRRVLELLGEDAPESVLAMVRHHATCLRRWAQLAEVAVSGRPAERQASTRGAEADQAAFVGGMHNISAPMADGLVARLAPLAFTHLLDVGGALGTWTEAFLNARPGARATLFDLPPVIPLAERRLRDAGLLDRVTFVAGDFYADPLPAGVDLVYLGAIIHQNSREQNRALFAKCRDALVDGGRLVIRDVIMDASRTEPMRGALFAINMLVATEGGTSYTFDEVREDLDATGLVQAELVNRGEFMDSLVRAVKPG